MTYQHEMSRNEDPIACKSMLSIRVVTRALLIKMSVSNANRHAVPAGKPEQAVSGRMRAASSAIWRLFTGEN
ncbi:MAG: hypothetical protein LBB76_09590 [Azoarcus sp.]|jgi:hypothetical protein|nr:hypothetical protein [Azoarcus sp.]